MRNVNFKDITDFLITEIINEPSYAILSLWAPKQVSVLILEYFNLANFYYLTGGYKGDDEMNFYATAFNQIFAELLINPTPGPFLRTFLHRSGDSDQALLCEQKKLHEFIAKSPIAGFQSKTLRHGPSGTHSKILKALQQEDHSLRQYLNTIQAFNGTDPITMVPLWKPKKEAELAIASKEISDILLMLPNFLNLASRWRQGHTVIYTFLMVFHHYCYLPYTLIAKKGFSYIGIVVDADNEDMQAVFPKPSQTCELVPKLLTAEVAELSAWVKSELIKVYKAFNLDDPHCPYFWFGNNKLVTIQALLKCWQALAKDQELKSLVDMKIIHKIKHASFENHPRSQLPDALQKDIAALETAMKLPESKEEPPLPTLSVSSGSLGIYRSPDSPQHERTCDRASDRAPSSRMG